MSESIVVTIDDLAVRILASRLRLSAGKVKEPQRSRILHRLPNTLFISHTSLDDVFIKGASEDNKFTRRESIWRICRERFYDPFYHSLRTGGADGYERIVGLALLASIRVLVVWSENAARSNYVRAELLIASESNKKIAAYLAPSAPTFPLDSVPLIYDPQSLRSFLSTW
jgi:hypothetical protein